MGIVATTAMIKNELAEMKTASEGRSLEDLAAQAQQELKLLENTTVNIAITGVSGAGKSSLVNALRDVKDDDEDCAAKTGVVETTMVPAPYPHPIHPKVTMWDLPGIGTPQFKPDKYLKDVNFSQYDFFIIVAKERFTEHDAKLALEIHKMQKKFFFVRTQIDVSLNAERRKRGFNENATLDQIRNYCCENLREAGMPSPEVFLISSWDLEKYDFPLLQEALEHNLGDLKKQVLIMAVPTYSKEALEKKKAAMRNLIWKLALTSCAFGAIPVPGVSFACDVAILVGAMQLFCRVFGLDEASLRKLSEHSGVPLAKLKDVIKYTQQAGGIKAEFVIDRLARSALCATATSLEFALNFIPVLGSVTGAGLSFFTTYYQLKSFLNDVVKDVENVHAKVIEQSHKSPE